MQKICTILALATIAFAGHLGHHTTLSQTIAQGTLGTLGTLGPNMLLGKTAFQSADYSPVTLAGNALSGSTTCIWVQTTPSTWFASEVGSNGDTWWTGDMGATKDVGTVVVRARQDCCPEQL